MRDATGRFCGMFCLAQITKLCSVERRFLPRFVCAWSNHFIVFVAKPDFTRDIINPEVRLPFSHNTCVTEVICHRNDDERWLLNSMGYMQQPTITLVGLYVRTKSLAVARVRRPYRLYSKASVRFPVAQRKRHSLDLIR